MSVTRHYLCQIVDKTTGKNLSPIQEIDIELEEFGTQLKPELFEFHAIAKMIEIENLKGSSQYDIDVVDVTY